MSRARYYGGSCNLWAGRSMLLTETDLASREWVPESAWPIPHSELAAYYPAAARVLRLPALERFDARTLVPAMSELERDLFSREPLVPRISLWAKSPLRFGAAYRSRLRRSSRVRLVLHANATFIRLSADGTAVETVEASTLEGRRLSVRARMYVIACGALENARLLLFSRDVRRQGIGNEFDLVGRYFMDHPRCVHGRVWLHPGRQLPLLRGRPLRDGKIQVGMGLSLEIQRREALLNHYATLEAEFSGYSQARYESFVQVMKVLLRRGYAGSRWDLGRTRLGDIPGLIYLLTPKELMPHFLYRWNAALRGLLPRRSEEACVAVYFCEQPPDPESRVSLSPERDRLGMNKLVLEWRLGPEVTRSVLRLQELLRERLKEAGIGELDLSADAIRFTDASHHLGTTRMAASPRTGVVDADGRVHGIPNLFMAGGSVFPSAGHANPTLTIVALSLRLAEHLRVRLSHSARPARGTADSPEALGS
ncbi:MAG: GMC oxidoreductase [Vicinamibacteria bacterium]